MLDNWPTPIAYGSASGWTDSLDPFSSYMAVAWGDRSEGFIDVGLFYGFGDGGSRFFSFDAS